MKLNDILAACFLIAVLAIGAAASIDWGTTGTGYFEIHRGFPVTNVVEFGLRDDGVVVWRESHAQPGWVTNSPAERVDPVWYTNMTIPLDRYWTNRSILLNSR